MTTNDEGWWAEAQASVHHNCLANLRFVAHLAAPGKGQAWDCHVCGAHFHRMNADAPAFPFEDLDPSDFELQPWEVI
jgi:hypothetical protein